MSASQGSVPSGRRIVALWLSDLLCELVVSQRLPKPSARSGGKLTASPVRRGAPFGVVVVGGDSRESVELSAPLPSEAGCLPTYRLAAVSVAAQRLGITKGQTVAEARAMVAGLEVRGLSLERIHAELEAVAEVALGFGITVATQPPLSRSESWLVAKRSQKPVDSERLVRELDTVWVDISGTAHLFGGEAELLVELASAVAELGHTVRLGLAEGPILAQALARWSLSERREVGVRASATRVAALPIVALPLDVERAAWLMQLGLDTWGQLAALPPAAVASRLAGSPSVAAHLAAACVVDAGLLLELCRGIDSTPLVPYRPPQALTEALEFDTPVEGLPPLLFVLRGLCARLSARLAGRGEAVSALRVTVTLDAPVARLVGKASRLEFVCELASPHWREQELFRLLSARLGRIALEAPAKALRITADQVTERMARQLEFSRPVGAGRDGGRDEGELPLLLSELVGDLGSERIGVLRQVDSHRPEAQTRLVLPRGTPAASRARGKATRRGAMLRSGGEPPVPDSPRDVLAAETGPREEQLTFLPRIGGPRSFRAPVRIFPRPIPIKAALRPDHSIFVEERAFTVLRVDFERRLEAVEWWSRLPTARDYYRLLLRGQEGVLEALVYVDRRSGARYLQGIYD